jgi:hypothetical protein
MLLASTLLLLVPTSARSAGKEGSFLTSPSRIVSSVAPGAESTVRITVKNLLGRPVTLRIGTADLAAGRDEYSRVVGTGDAPRGAGTWLSPSVSTVRLLDGQRRDVSVTIHVPADASAGGHYGAIVVEQDQQPDAADAVAIHLRVVTNVTVIVPGAISYGAKVTGLHVPKLARDHVHLSFTVRNTGNIHTRPVAQVELRGPHGWTRRREIVVAELLPGGRRTLATRLDVAPIPGRIEARVRLRLEDRARTKAVSSTFWGYRTRSLQILLMVVGGVVIVLLAWWVREWMILRRFMRALPDDFASDDETDADT